MIFPRIISFICLIFIPKIFSLLNETIYVGCYDARLATTFSYTTVVKPLFSWEICAKLCTNQLTVYAGIVAKNFTCFCGNEIAELLIPTEDSKCTSCHEDPTKYCGGSGVVSLYQLRINHKNPTTVLLATNKGIAIYHDLTYFMASDQKYHFREFESVNSDAISVGYHFRRQEIYYMSSNKKIYKVAYVPVLMKFYHPMLIIETNCTSTVDFTLDWMRDKLYWYCAATRNIKSVNLDGSGVREELSNVYESYNIEVEPFMQSIWFETQKRLSVYKFSNLVKDVFYEYMFRETIRISIDVQQETVYAIGSYSSGSSKKYLVSTNYNGTVFRVIYTGIELSNPYSLDVVNGVVIWINRNNSIQNTPLYTIYKGIISSKYELENLTILYSDSNVIMDLKIYGPAVQTPSIQYMCKNNNCSHSCSAVTPSLVHCSCPESMLLSKNERTCIGISKTVAVTTGVSTPKQPNSTEITTLSQFSESTDLIVPTKSSLELRLQEHEDNIQLFYIVGFVCLAIFVAIVIFHVYMYVMVKKTKGNFILYFNKESGLAEPTYSEPNRGTCNLYT